MTSTWVIGSSIGVWFAMVAAIVAASAFAGVAVTPDTGAVTLLVSLMPPAMMLRLRVRD